MVVVAFEPEANEGVFELNKPAELLQPGQQGRRMANRRLKLFVQMAKLQPLDGAKPKIRNSLRSLRCHRELKSRNQWEIVVGLLIGMHGQAKLCQHPFSRRADFVQDVGKRNKEGAARQHDCFHVQ